MSESDQYQAVSLFSVTPDEPLPFSLFVYYQGRFISYRNPGQSFEVAKYNRFIYKRISKVYIPKEEFEKYKVYVNGKQAAETARLTDPSLTVEQRVTNQTVHQIETYTRELFLSMDDADLQAKSGQIIAVARSTVEKICTKPYLRIFEAIPEESNTVITHSIRVSLMSAYLAYQLGFVNAIALEHIAAAGMLHDIGKTQLLLSDDLEMTEDQEADLMRKHPILSCEMLKKSGNVPEEVLRIIIEHHEARDGSGFPNGIRGRKMHGLSKVFTIANTFDNLVSALPGERARRYADAVEIIESRMRNCFEPSILPKALRLLVGKTAPK